MGAQLVREVATKTNDAAGDGTTTATVLAQAIIHEGLKNIAAGANPMVLRKGIAKAVDAAVDTIKANSKKVSGSEDTIVYPKPNVGKTYKIQSPATTDEFNDRKLGLQWQWNHNPDNTCCVE